METTKDTLNMSAEERTQNMQEVHDYVRECGYYTIATVDGDQPHVRAFSSFELINGRLVAADPYSVHGLVASSTINLWDVKYGSMLKPDTPDSKGTKYFRATYCLPDEADTSSVEQVRDDYISQLVSKRKMRASGNYVGNPKCGLSILQVVSLNWNISAF